MASTCYKCGTALQGADERKRKRQRKCAKCTRVDSLAKRNENPVQALKHKWRTSGLRRYPSAPKALFTTAVVEEVWDKWEHKCAISGETDHALLCVNCHLDPGAGVCPTQEDLVIVTTHEAQSMAKIKSHALRMTRFPDDVLTKLVPPSLKRGRGDDDDDADGQQQQQQQQQDDGPLTLKRFALDSKDAIGESGE